ncbi:MAG: methyltransferase [Chloroflexi bacterium]|nr:methyltransferase [Chloroflexota bacterium]
MEEHDSGEMPYDVSSAQREQPGDPAAIETLLQQHAAVADAAVLSYNLPDGPQLVAFFVEHGPQAAATRSTGDREQVTQWQAVFDEVYRQAISSQQDAQVSLRVWTSSYTDQQIPEPEIFECIDDSVARIRALQPRRVLELGCGTGLLLLRIAPGCEYYCGTDVSQAALDRLAAEVRRQQAQLPEIALLHAPADELDGIPEAAFDVVILNEVVQYFPSSDYLAQVLERAVTRVKPGGAIFVGGVRSLPLLEAFHTSVQLYQAADQLPIPELRQRIQQRLAQEKELAVDPAFFAALQRELPQVTDLSIQLKGGWALNELTKFRYDVVLRVGCATLVSGASQELDWQTAGLTVESLRRLLAETAPTQLRLIGVPNARVLADLAAIDLLTNPGDLATAGDLKRALAAATAGVAPADLWALGQELPYTTRISWSARGEPGAYDVVLTRRAAEQIVALTTPADAAPAASSPRWAQYANRPLQGSAAGSIVAQLRTYLSRHLTSGMLPPLVISLPALPTDANGNLDREALRSLAAQFVPRTSVEASLLQIWGDVLHLPLVSLQSDFFALGGTPAQAQQVVRRAGAAFGLGLSFEQLFDTPTVEAAALAIEFAVLDEIERLAAEE